MNFNRSIRSQLFRTNIKELISHCPNANLPILRRQNDLKRNSIQLRTISTTDSKTVIDVEGGILKRIAAKLPFFDSNKSKMMASAYILYENIADRVNYLDFFEELNLPDTFYSWFVITELHVWMLSVRGMIEGDDGRQLRNYLVEALWADVAQRVKKLGASNPSVTRAQVGELSEQLQASLIAYDEGLQSDDVILAGALWRRFYQHGEFEPECLEKLVRYVRKQLMLLDQTSKSDLLEKHNIKWIPFKEK